MSKNVVTCINNNMKKYRDEIAIVDGDLRFTYGNVDVMSNKVCEYLLDKLIGREDVVAVYMERSYLSVITVLGILKAGAAFLPVDIETPIKRAEKMFELSSVKCVIVNQYDENDLFINIYDILKNNLGNNKPFFFDQITDDTLLAYVLFTSGSTGIPKGVMIEHGGMSNHIFEKIRILNLNKDSIVAHNAPIGFDVSVWQMLAPLCTGGRMVIFSKKTVLNIRNFVNVLYDNNVQVLEGVPTYLHLLFQEIKMHQYNFHEMKYIISTGEVLTKNLVNKCFEVLPDVLLVNAYGPTEASDDILHCVIDRNNTFDSIPLGKQINNINLKIVRKDGDLCEIGEPGELVVEGICVGRGYVGNENETKMQFQYNRDTGERIYFTGDLVSLESDENYYYHDRLDMQIELHGKRIEVHEIENIIKMYTGVTTSSVVFDSKKQQLNAGYIGEKDINMVKLKTFMKTFLPSYMIPTYIVRIEEIPTTQSGKTDSHALNEMIILSSEGHQHDEYSEDERELIDMIMEILQIKELPRTSYWKEDMREIGLNSINAIKLIIEIEERYNVEVDDENLVSEVLYNFERLSELIQNY